MVAELFHVDKHRYYEANSFIYIYIFLFIIENTMRKPHLKIVCTSQGHIYKYEDLKRKIYNYNSNIYFNQKFLQKNIIPNLAMIKTPNTFPASKFTQQNHLPLK